MDGTRIGRREGRSNRMLHMWVTADDADNVALQTPQISKQMSLEQELAGEKEDQTECFTCEFTADDADNVTLLTPPKSKHMS